jgi:asparagine synthase (glutamine-hydrolysing)
MKEDATVGISGESSDEVFGGYPWFHNEAAVNAPTFPWFAMMAAPLASDTRRAMSWLSPEVEQRVKPMERLRQLYQEGLAEVPRLEGEDPKEARMREVFYLNLTHFLPMLLDRKDRMSMAVGFEVRVPFCDHRLVEYVWNIPWVMKTVGNIEKGILRRAMTGILPDDARLRRKSAYPSSQNPTYEVRLRQWVLQILSDPNAPIQPFINASMLRTLAEGKVPLPGEAAAFLFERMIQVNAWLQEYGVSVV